jgi:hypothetical protein
MRRAICVLWLAIASLAIGCGRTRYDSYFRCGAPGTPDCPAGAECPEVPLGTNACGDLPELLDSDPIPADAGRPLGCEAGLPYGNPSYGDSQVVCFCKEGPVRTTSDAGVVGRYPADWQCPI